MPKHTKKCTSEPEAPISPTNSIVVRKVLNAPEISLSRLMNMMIVLTRRICLAKAQEDKLRVKKLTLYRATLEELYAEELRDVKNQQTNRRDSRSDKE